MKVSDAQTTGTNVVIGKVEVQEMQIASTPEFYNILSSSIYQYASMAMLREMLFNATDANEDNGKHDVPVRVEFFEDHILIHDEGKGIPHDMIVPIFGTYGQGTKELNADATGGFGLGSKSPLAYTSNFEVKSHFGGKCTIYRVNKGNRASNGKPSIVTIMQLDSDRTGVSVKLPIHSGDYGTLYSTMLNLIRASGKNIQLFEYTKPTSNIEPELIEKEVNQIPLGSAVGSLCVMPTGYGIRLPNIAQVNVRYAGIIYPMPSTKKTYDTYQDGEVEGYYDEYFDKYIGAFERFKQYVSFVDSSISDYGRESTQWIIQAENGTLGLHPSREVLTASDLTYKSLTALLNQVMESLEKAKEQAEKENLALLTSKILDVKLDRHYVGELPTIFQSLTKNRVISLSSESYDNPSTLFKEAALGKPVSKADADDLLHLWLKSLIKSDEWKAPELFTKRMISYLRKGYIVPSHRRVKINFLYVNDGSSPLPGTLISLITPYFPEVMKEVSKSTLDFTRFRLSFFDLDSYEWVVNPMAGKHSPSYSTSSVPVLSLLELKNRTVILTTNIRKMHDRYTGYRRTYDTKLTTALVYHCGPSKKAIMEARKVLENIPGINFVDFTKALPWERNYDLTDTSHKASGNTGGGKPTGVEKDKIPSIRNALKHQCGVYNLAGLDASKNTLHTIDEWDFCVRIPVSERKTSVSFNHMEGVPTSIAVILARRYSDRIGVVASVTQLAKYNSGIDAKQKAREMFIAYHKELWDELRNPYLTYLKSRLFKGDFSPLTVGYQMAKLFINKHPEMVGVKHPTKPNARLLTKFMRVHEIAMSVPSSFNKEQMDYLESINSQMEEAKKVLPAATDKLFRKFMEYDGYPLLCIPSSMENLLNEEVVSEDVKDLLKFVLKQVRKVKL